MPNFVAITTSSRRPLSALPSSVSDSPTVAVDVGGVEQIDAGVERGIDDRLGPLSVHPSAEVVAADADHGDHQAGRAEPAKTHICHGYDPMSSE